MCLSSSERGGPRRCSGDTLRAYEEAIGGVATLEREAMQLRAELADDPHAAVNDASAAQVDRPAAPMLFADKEGRVEKIRAEIDRAVEELGSAQMWQDYLEVAGKFPTRSFGNQILILKQMPEATMVCGAGKWRNEHNRTIRKGSKAIWIQAPMSRKVVDPVTGEEERKVFGFKPVPVYDVSQTEGDPLPEPPAGPTDLEGAAPQGMVDDLCAALDRGGFPVSYEDLGPQIKGFTSFDPQRVVINSRGSEAQRAKTLVHELAHVELGHGQRAAEYHSRPGGERPDMEVEAESTAYVVSTAYGLDTGSYSFGYIDHWAKGNTDRVKATAAAVVTGASKLLAEFNR